MTAATVGRDAAFGEFTDPLLRYGAWRGRRRERPARDPPETSDEDRRPVSHEVGDEYVVVDLSRIR
ncbi:hypothetical protein [Nonomuraea longicatena]|uniref:Uncharacterized protein n=1 Tax=Nonomuraea longicatena TaxID=83682 RepID=A0ABP3Z3Q2_9ACTN